jgi:hypothetical protein
VATEQLRGRKNGIFRYLRMGVVAVKLPLLLAAPEPFTQRQFSTWAGPASDRIASRALGITLLGGITRGTEQYRCDRGQARSRLAGLADLDRPESDRRHDLVCAALGWHRRCSTLPALTS